MKNIIEVENLTKKYGSFVAVNNISFEGEEGDVVAFLGPNGAGKTTTMRILTCYIPATLGTARIDGFDIFNDSFKVRERIGYAPEIPPLYPDMTVKSFLKFVAQIKQIPAGQVNMAVDKVTELCALSEMKTRLISKLSRGYRQRVGIAQAIIHNPKVIILDEPTVGLDPNQVVEMREVIKNLANDKTVMISTHILSEAEAMCKKVIIINKGEITAQGQWVDLQQDIQEMIVIKMKIPDINDEKINKIKTLENVNDIEVLEDKTIKIYTPKKTNIKPKLIKLLAENDWSIDEMVSEKLNLEEIFKRSTVSKKV
ncbi:MAG: ATP-binding cassette domain-containing protein [Cyanobacteriota bacterium]